MSDNNIKKICLSVFAVLAVGIIVYFLYDLITGDPVIYERKSTSQTTTASVQPLKKTNDIIYTEKAICEHIIGFDIKHDVEICEVTINGKKYLVAAAKAGRFDGGVDIEIFDKY